MHAAGWCLLWTHALKKVLIYWCSNTGVVIHVSDKTGICDSVFLVHFYSNVRKLQQCKATSSVGFHTSMLLMYLSEFLKMNVVLATLKIFSNLNPSCRKLIMPYIQIPKDSEFFIYFWSCRLLHGQRCGSWQRKCVQSTDDPVS